MKLKRDGFSQDYGKLFQRFNRRNLPMCRGDRHLIAQALLNLMTNAAQAMERQEGERRIEVGSSWSSVSSRDGYHPTFRYRRRKLNA